jgi:hypothetical protein
MGRTQGLTPVPAARQEEFGVEPDSTSLARPTDTDDCLWIWKVYGALAIAVTAFLVAVLLMATGTVATPHA